MLHIDSDTTLLLIIGLQLPAKSAEAQHIILVEPLLNPATEAQVVGRVHRIGQTQKTYVHSFVTRNTVEENVFQLNRERAANVDSSAMAGRKGDATKEDQKFSARCR